MERDSMYSQRIRVTIGMHERQSAIFIGYENSCEIHAEQKSLVDPIFYNEIKYLSSDEVPVGADVVFWVIACCLCFIPIIGWLLIPLIYIFRSENTLAIASKNTFLVVHGPRVKLVEIWSFIEEKAGRTLHKGVIQKGKPSFTDKKDIENLDEPILKKNSVKNEKFCRTCGNKVEIGDKFCEECGSNV